ncbi:trafficking protein particle complex subunit 13 [Tanacetum coccineum]
MITGPSVLFCRPHERFSNGLLGLRFRHRSSSTLDFCFFGFDFQCPPALLSQIEANQWGPCRARVRANRLFADSDTLPQASYESGPRPSCHTRAIKGRGFESRLMLASVGATELSELPIVRRWCQKAPEVRGVDRHVDSPSAVPRHLFSSHSVSSDPSCSDLTYRNRFLLSDDSDAMGVPGLLVLPQSFGAIYLGENFCSYISINNSSNYEVRDIIIKSEIQTERQRILLLDTSKAPVESIRAGGRYDFIVQHDVKELGAHTLVCTALYYDGDAERKYLPQYFKFMVSNPLSVRTKVRVVKVG